MSFFGELKRRRVLRVAITYAIASWVMFQVVESLFPALQLEPWTVTLVAALLLIGFPLALALAWAFDVTPHGIERTGRAAPDVAQTNTTHLPPLPTQRRRSVAVLPFTNLSGDPANEYFSDGITEDILTQLSCCGDLKVISRTSVMQYKKRDRNLRQIASELGVGTVLDGSVRRVGDRVRITAQLVDANSDEHLWANWYDRELHDVFAVQTDVAHNIAQALNANLTSAVLQGSRTVPTHSMEAYQLVLRGRQYADSTAPEVMQRAITLFEQAITLDPNYRQAYAELVYAIGWLTYWGHVRPADSALRARAAAHKLQELDTQGPDTHGALAYVALHYDWDWPIFEREIRQALQLRPLDPSFLSLYSKYLTTRGRYGEAIDYALRGIEVSPLSKFLLAAAGQCHYYAGNYQAAIDFCARALELDPRYFYAEMVMAGSNAALGNIDRALEHSERACQNSDYHALAVGIRGLALGFVGQRSEVEKLLHLLLARQQQRYVSTYGLAMLYQGLGDVNGALTQLEQAYNDRDFYLLNIRDWQRFDGFRGNPRYEALVQKIG